MLQRQAGAISRTTGIHAFLFSGLSRREGARGEIRVARIERFGTRQQKHCEECGDDAKRPLVTCHGQARRKNTASLELRRSQPLKYSYYSSATASNSFFGLLALGHRGDSRKTCFAPADIAALFGHVRFPPESRHQSGPPRGLLRANSDVTVTSLCLDVGRLDDRPPLLDLCPMQCA